MVFVTRIGLVVLITENLLLVMPFMLVLVLYLGQLKSNQMLHVQALRLSTVQWHLLLLNYIGLECYFHVRNSHLILFYHPKKPLYKLYNTILQYSQHLKLLIKIIFLYNKIIYLTITIIQYNTVFILSLSFFLFKNYNHQHRGTTHTDTTTITGNP